MSALDTRTGKVAWEKRLEYAACEGGGGATATAGGLVFHVEPDGVFQAYDAKTGDVAWRFQTGEVGLPGGAGPGGGSAISYESQGDQYVALTINRAVWAFKIGGTVAPRPAPAAPPTAIAWNGQIVDTAIVNLGSATVFNIASAGRRLTWDDAYAVSPTRIKTKAGTLVTWKNTTMMAHTIASRDGSWTTGATPPGGSGSATIAKPGTYEYICSEHPWSIGQLIVE